MPTFSIIIPSYNCAPYVADSVRSCLDQKVPAHEIIVVDDGSRDDTAGAMAPFRGHPKVQFVQQPNAGVSVARNNGIERATGDYIIFLDADDLFLPHTVETWTRLFARYPELDIGVADYWLSHTPGSEFSAHESYGGARRVVADYATQGEGALLLGEAFGPAYLRSDVPNAFVHTSAIAIRRSLFDKVGPFKPGMVVAQDHDMWRRAFLGGTAAVVLGPPISRYFRWRGTTEKYVIGCRNSIEKLRVQLAGAPAFSEKWLRLRKQISREYISMVYGMGITRAPHGRLARALAASIAYYPLPKAQARYLALLMLPRPIVRQLVARAARS